MGKQPAGRLDPVRTRHEAVTVERRLELQPSGVIAVVTVTASGGTPQRTSVIDYLPGNWPVEEIGFHGEHAPERGSAGTDSVVFDVVAAPESPARVVYGMVLEEPVAVEDAEETQASSLPRIDKVEPAVEAGAAEGEEPALSEMDPAEFFEMAGGDDEPAATATDEGAAGGEDEPPAGGRSVLDALAEELASGDVDDESLETVQDALVAPFGKSTRLRLRRIESRLEEFDVYLEALREIIDEHGTGVEFLREVRESIEAVEEETGAVRQDLEEAADERDAMADELDGLSSDLSALRSTVVELEQAVEVAEGSVDSLEAELDAVEAELEPLRRQVEDWDAIRHRLVDALEVGSGGDDDGGRSVPTFPEEARSGRRFPGEDQSRTGPPDDRPDSAPADERSDRASPDEDG